MKYLIAERDDLERKGLRWLITSHQLPYSEMIEVREPERCIQHIQKKQPDVIVLELDMFTDDQLHFLENYFSQHDARLIAHTGRKTFDSAYRALKLCAGALFVKPFDTDEWIKTLRQLIRRTRKPSSEYWGTTDEWSDTSWIYHLLFGLPIDQDETKNMTKHLPFERPPTTVVVLDVDEESRTSINPKELLDTVREHLAEYRPLVVYVERKIVLLFDLHSIAKDATVTNLEQIMLRFCRKVKTEYRFSLTAGIGNSYDHPKYLHQSYLEATQALDRRFYFGGNQVFSDRHPFILYRIDPFLSPEERDELLHYLEQTDRQGIKDWLYRLFGTFPDPSDRFPSPDDMRIKLTSVMANLRRFMLKKEYLTGAENQYRNVLERILNGEVLADIVQQLLYFCYQLCDLVEKRERTYQSLLVQQLIQYIQEHYAEPITLKDASRLIDRNPYYISHLFKQETGWTFSDYIQKTRVERAKGLLKTPRLKIHDIARQVGFEDPAYFSKVFKKWVQQTPREWKSKNSTSSAKSS